MMLECGYHYVNVCTADNSQSSADDAGVWIFIYLFIFNKNELHYTQER